ncbi:MAG TPA: apolipoprotein N-acyltransferase [Opitutaceae bacterium]
MASADAATFDPYTEQPSFWKQNATGLTALAVLVSTVLMTVLAFPPYSQSEFAYAFAAPAIFWAYTKPSWKLFSWTMVAAQVVAWTFILWWLRHVSYLAIFLLGPFVGVWIGLWYGAVRWTMPRMLGCDSRTRVLAMLGLGGLWVVNEWTRDWFLTGFPWLPLAASQWNRSVVLQTASLTGASGVSFLLIVMNIGFAAYGHRLLREKQRGLRKRSPEFMCALLLLMGPTYYVLFTQVTKQDRAPFLRVSTVQPDIPQTLKWDPSQSDFIFNTLGSLTAKAATNHPDLILWPEASTPFAVKGDDRVQGWTEELVRRVRTPLLLGSISVVDRHLATEAWRNEAFVVDPVAGLQKESYAKRHLVPFGEYVPLRSILGWLNKIVPVGDDDFRPGSSSSPLVVTTMSGVFEIAPQICYEDVFPQYSREAVLSGADLIAVMTNDAWYGTKEGESWQHMANSVLRAVELRRPVVRCGNNGWSGWIDEFGRIQGYMTSESKGIYYRGTHTFQLTRDRHWEGQQTFYAEHGDWFVLVSGVLVVVGFLILRSARPMLATNENGASEISESAPF